MKSLLLSTALLLTSLVASAQSWQWGKRGGGSSDGTSSSAYRENVIDMATDKAGNVYALVIIEAQGLPNYSTGTSATTTGNFLAQGNRDIGIISYRCDGTFRWRRTIGGVNDDLPTSIGADTLGGIYVTGTAISPFVNNSPNIQVTFEGGGPTWPHGHNRFGFITRYDTSGTFSWLRQPMPDTADRSRQARIMDATVAPGGEAYCLAYLRPGLVGGTTNTIVTTGGVHMLRYSSTGTLLSLTPMQMGIDPQATQFMSFRTARRQSGAFVVTGENLMYGGIPSVGFTLGGQAVTRSMFVASLSPTGLLQWARFSTDSFSGAYGRPAIDAQGNIYVAAQSFGSPQFNGTPLVNTLSINQFPFAVKLDSNGNNQWLTCGSTNGATYGYAGVLRGSEFIMTGGYPGRLQWPGLATLLQNPSNVGYDPYVVRFNAQTGAVIAVDSLEGSGFDDLGTAIAADRSGNVYVGGYFSNNISVAGTTYTNNGGATDYFIARYGTANCNCVLPTPAFNRTMANRTVTATYTAAVMGLDSVVWTWGNGQRTKVMSNYAATVSYTYPSASGAGPFTVCATAYTACGQNQVCQTVTIPTSVEEVNAQGGGLLLYPNPARQTANVEYSFPRSSVQRAVQVYDVSGRLMATLDGAEVAGRWSINLDNWAAGLYKVVLKADGKAVAHSKLSVTH